MAKIIKRVGIVFFAVFITSLLLVCCSVTNSLQEHNNNANLDQNGNITDFATYESLPIAEEILLDGKTCQEQADKWGKAIEKSLEGKHILVTLMADWIAESNATYTTSFGTGVGLNEGRIQVPPTANITLDLNGYTINRGLTTTRRRGQVIVLYQSTLTIKDSKFDYAKLLDEYKANSDRDLSAFGAGRITGGCDDNNAGAIYMEDNCLLTLNSGIICNNTGVDGGAVQCNIDSSFVMNNGLICNNIATLSGGGVFAKANSNVTINGGIFHKNTASGCAGGVFGKEINSINISGGIFAYNKTLTGTGEGGAVFGDEIKSFVITGGTYEYNYANHCGGAIRIGGDCEIVSISGAYINNNSSRTYAGGLRIASNLTRQATVADCLIVNNFCKEYGGGATFEHDTRIGAGLKIYNNTINGEPNNLSSGIQFTIMENLMKDGKTTYIGISKLKDVIFTKGYISSGNTLSPDRFFFSDTDGLVVTTKTNEAVLTTGTKPTAQLNWSWGSNANEKTTKSSVTLPYKTGGYNISIGGGSFYKNTTASNKVSGTNFAILEPGEYAFYADGNYLNPTFNVTIEKAKTKVVPPITKNYIFMYSENIQINFMPENFDANTMEISYNRQTIPGKYTAVVRLKDNYNTTWVDGSTASLNYEYEILHPGILAKDSSGYEYIYKDNGIRKSYSSGKYFHRVNDNDISLVDGDNRYIMGGIIVNTKLSVFLNNLRNDLTLIKVYNKNGNIIYDGLLGTRSDLSQTLATGYKVELYSNSTDTTPFDTIYLSVLGDINGDGRINASDVSYLRQVANDSTLLESMSLERQLACMINNKGGITEVDSEILRNYIGKEIDLDKFMESKTASTSDAYTYLSLDRDNMLRIVSETKTNVIGNISVNTSVEMLKTKLAEMGINISAMTIYNRKGYEVTDNTAIVGTGWSMEVGGEKTYLSVLGDLTGDGRITAADISYLRAIAASDTTNVEDCILLSAILLNKGGITTADGEVLKLAINNKISIDKY